MSKYLVEIGTEELPYKFIPSAMEQLTELFQKALNDNRIDFKNISAFGTPRRVAVIIDDISQSQPDIIKTLKGPPSKAAYNEEGQLTQAAIGFAKKQGVDPMFMYKELVGNVEYVFVEIKETGRKTSDLLGEIIPETVLKLQGSHFMKWGDQDIKFSRPIRWIVSLLDTEEVKINIGNVKSTRFSRGHRFLQENDILISSADNYIKELYDANVIVDQQVRKNQIINLANEMAQSVNGRAHLSPDLVNEVTFLVEWPVPILGSFDTKYLTIPKDVITTVMASHQRYFPVFARENDNLLNYFITISNISDGSTDNIKKGNQRVIKARLDDAIFFYTEDTRRTLESRIEDLKGVTFQKGLGTVFEKSERIKEISNFIARSLDLDNNTSKDIERTAVLCKTDLVTNLVREFTELQGIIGSEYAKLNGENSSVVAGIREHYQPLSSEDDPADSLTGKITAISDKLDTIAGVFALNKAPTGSADPLGLRRAAIGILLTVIKKGMDINLSQSISYAISCQSVHIPDKTLLEQSIREFIIQRLRIYLNETYRYDIVEAALSAKDPLMDLNDLIKRIHALSELIKKENYMLFHEAVNRIIRIIKNESYSLNINTSLFAHEAEKELFNSLENINKGYANYNELIKDLESSIGAIQKFFDDVLVMDPDTNIRQNRLALLGNIQLEFLKLADFSKIVA